MGLHVLFLEAQKTSYYFLYYCKKKKKNRPSVGTDTNRGQVKKKVKIQETHTNKV
jgi:hypothetical protein